MRTAIRISYSNPDHHLWNHNGTWWCHTQRGRLRSGERKRPCQNQYGCLFCLDWNVLTCGRENEPGRIDPVQVVGRIDLPMRVNDFRVCHSDLQAIRDRDHGTLAFPFRRAFHLSTIR